MTINIIGSCDKRPVLFTVMKICQELGDVLLITSNSRLQRLSDTGESLGHCQNTMIAIASEGIDEFWAVFPYDVHDFEYVIVDNILSGDADLTIYVKGVVESPKDLDMLEYIEDYQTIDLYRKKVIDATTLIRCEEFEALKDFVTIGDSIASLVAGVMAPALHTDAKNLETIAKKQTSTHMAKLPAVKKPRKFSFGGK